MIKWKKYSNSSVSTILHVYTHVRPAVRLIDWRRPFL
jgi:hypothetical protein